MIDTVDDRLILYLKSFARGSAEARSAQELAEKFAVDVSQIQLKISHLRGDRKVPICGTPQDGYFWPQSYRDIDNTIANLKITKVIAGIQEGADREFGEPMLDF